jgi:quinol monooxygenase YgiN
MVMLTVSAAARSGKRHELLDTFRQIVEKTRPEKGCHECRLSQDIDHENLIYLEEVWQDRSHLDEYFRSDIFGALLGAVKLLGKAHDIRINDGSTTEGLEAVQSARSI